MISYTIYIYISSITRAFACFECICRIRLCEPKTYEYEIILRPCGSEKIAKATQNDPTRTNHDKYYGS